VHRRLVAAVSAVLLALVGGVLLTGYVSAADQRAMAGMATAPVLVVVAPVPAGTPAEALVDLVAVEELPAKAVAPGALTTLDAVAGQQTTAELAPGEQVLASRFAVPEKKGVEVPADMHELSVLLESQRVLGSSIVPGDRVGVFVSTEQGTHLTLHKVLVTRVQGGITPPTETEPPAGGAEPAPAPVPEGSVMVTLALTAPDAEKVVWARENGSIWLSLERTDVPEGGTRVVTGEGIFE
jgi:pilus assembly protein CpaB